MAGEHRMRKQLFRCKYVVVLDWNPGHPGWWRMAWPEAPRHLEASKV